MRTRALALGLTLAALAGCGSGDDGEPDPSAATVATTEGEPALVERVVPVAAGRRLFVRCMGEGTPTVVMEAGDTDDSASYDELQLTVAEETRACSYDRGNIGESGPAPGPRRLPQLLRDLEGLLRAADLPPPYVLVGASGGGYIVIGYALAHRSQVAGLVTFDTFAPDPDPPADLVKTLRWDHPDNVEKRDYLAVENQAWDARRRIGDVPVTIVSDRAEPRGVKGQKGWLVLSPRAKQVLAGPGHDILGDEPELAAKVVLDVLRAAE